MEPTLAQVEFPQELRLLLACAAPVQAQPTNAIRSLAATQLNWGQLLSLADRHALIPRLYYNLATFANFIPSDVLERLRAEFEMIARRALWLTQLLGKVMERFRRQGIVALAHKGPVLAEMLYQNLALRQFTDLDILIRAQDFAAARSALAEIGFTPHLTLTPEQERAYLVSGYESAFDGMGNQHLIEMQWRILPAFYAVDFDLDSMFARAQKIDIAGEPVETLCREDLLIVLAVHAAKHIWGKLLWLSDIAELSAQPVDWHRVIVHGKRLGITRILGINFLLSRELFGSPVPDQLQSVVASMEVKNLAGNVVQQIMRGEEPDTKSPSYFRRVMQLRERTSDQLRFVIRLAFTPSIGDWSAVRLPPSLFPLYRVVRLFRLLGKLA